MAKNKKLDKTAYNSLLMSAVLWGFAPLFYKQSLLVVGIAVFLMLRFTIGALFLLATNKTKFVRLTGSLFASIAVLCLLDNIFANVAYSYGIQRTTVLHASMILLTIPFFVYFFAAIVLREKVHKTVVIGGLVSATGLLFIVLSGTQTGEGFSISNILGDAALLLEVVATSLGVVLARKLLAKNKLPSEQLAFTGYALAGFSIFMFVLVSGNLTTVQSISIETWAWIIGAGVIAGGIPIGLYYGAARRLPASRLADGSYVTPVVAAGVGILFLGESLTPSYIIGASIVVTGLLIGHRKIHPVLIAHRLQVDSKQLLKIYRIPQKAYQYIRYDE